MAIDVIIIIYNSNQVKEDIIMDGSSFDFIQNPIIPGQQRQNNPVPQQPVMQPPQPYVPVEQDVDVVVDSHLFDFASDKPNRNNTMTVYPDMRPEETGMVRRKPRKKKEDGPHDAHTDIIRADGQIEDLSSAYTYAETTNMARRTIDQLDLLASEIKDELESVRMARTMNRKYDHIVGLSNSLGQILSTKITAIREINNSISKANDLDYRREKDRRSVEAAQNDDKGIMDLYTSFVANSGMQSNMNNIAPSILNSTVPSNSIIRAMPSSDGTLEPIEDYGYLNYVSNMTPEQRLMYMEQDPNVKQVVVYDASNGNKFFQVMNMATGQAITGVPVRDAMFLEDTTIDLKHKIAKNINLNEVYPLVVINDQVTKEY